jgi:nucleoside 2-deoxyribosyltransferase
MKIYFGGSIAGGRDFLETYQRIGEIIREKGHHILTEHVLSPEVFDLEKDLTPQQIYERDIKWLRESDCLIAEVSHPSLGVGYEICYALGIQKPVLCLYQKGVYLSRMILGDPSEGLQVQAYEGKEDLEEIIKTFLKGIEHGE